MNRAQKTLPRATSPALRQERFVFEVTQQCNRKCKHCYGVWKNSLAYPMGDLSTEATIEMLQGMIEQTGASTVILSGGEPLVRQDLDAIIDYLASVRMRIHLWTNGSLLTPAVLQRFLPDKIREYRLALFSADHEVFDRMTGVRGSFEETTRAITELKQAGQRVVGAFVAMQSTLPTWRKTAELAVSLGVDAMEFNRFVPAGMGARNIERLQPTPESLLAGLDVAEEIAQRYRMPIRCVVPLPPCLFDPKRWPRLEFHLCSVGGPHAYYALDPLGNVRPCPVSRTMLGNIRRMQFASMAEAMLMKDYINARPDVCTDCHSEEACMGGCKAAAEICFGSPWHCDPFLEANRALAVGMKRRRSFWSWLKRWK